MTAHDEIQLLENRSIELKTRFKVIAVLIDHFNGELGRNEHAIALRKAIVGPIRRLPNEILAEIFWQACNSKPWSPFNMVGIPWVDVGQGSKDEPRNGSNDQKERDVVEKELRSSGIQKRQAEIIRECLLRSGSYPFDFSLASSELPGFSEPIASDGEMWTYRGTCQFATCALNANGIGDIQCELSQTSGHVSPPPHPVGSFNHFRVLTFKLLHPDDLNAFGSMPVLEELYFASRINLKSLNDQQWSHLRVLTLPVIWPEQQCSTVISILKAYTSLITLHVQQPPQRIFWLSHRVHHKRDAIPVIDILNLSSSDSSNKDGVIPLPQHLKVTIDDEDEANRWFQTIRPRSRCFPPLQIEPLKSLTILYRVEQFDFISGPVKELEEIGLQVSLKPYCD
ncbi:hypothetical protein C8J56DRAFT_1111646 [Mycena floridula]|nr:hypothetical protein C8J56DRAFT_1111646 [Mycena floridula]